MRYQIGNKRNSVIVLVYSINFFNIYNLVYLFSTIKSITHDSQLKPDHHLNSGQNS